MSAHTPGPLEVRTGPHPGSGISTEQYVAGLTRGTGPVFLVIAPDPERPAPDYLVTAVTGDGPASRANAHLYAAAPELLAELKYLARGHHEWSAPAGFIERLEALIAKAEAPTLRPWTPEQGEDGE